MSWKPERHLGKKRKKLRLKKAGCCDVNEIFKKSFKLINGDGCVFYTRPECFKAPHLNRSENIRTYEEWQFSEEG